MKRCVFLLLSGIVVLSGAQLTAQQSPHGQRTCATLMRPFQPGASLAPDGSRPQHPFIMNEGQWDQTGLFLARWNGLDLWVTSDGLVYNFSTPHGDGPQSPLLSKSDRRTMQNASAQNTSAAAGHVVRMRFVHASAGRCIRMLNEQPDVRNYFIGNDPRRWATNVKSYEKLVFAGLYPGIEAAVYVDGASGMPAYDLLVAPGADPGRIRLAFDGAERVRVNKAGNLVISTSLGEIEQKGLRAFQPVNGELRDVTCAFRRHADGTIGFEVGDFRRDAPLVIDPLLYSTFLAADGYCRGSDVTVDGANQAYITGWAASASYPVSLGAYQGVVSGGQDVYVTKFSADGRTVMYSTFVGGADDDVGNGIAVDNQGAIYVAGYTYSDAFPVKNAVQTLRGGNSDAFVFKIDPFASGAAQLVYSTFLGGSYRDLGVAVALHGSDAYVAGVTYSNNFPLSTPYQSEFALGVVNNSGGDNFVTHLNTAGAMAGSTYLGGTQNDEAFDLTVDGQGNAYICGVTGSQDYPVAGVTTAYDADFNNPGNGADAFVAKLSPGMNTLLYSTYLGGRDDDWAYAIAVDAAGNMYVTGRTNSTAFPVVVGSFDTVYNGGDDIYLTKINANGQALGYSTFIGGSNLEWANEIALDAENNAWIGGSSLSYNFPATPNAYAPTRAGAPYDMAVAGLSADGRDLMYATFLGGTSGDTATGMAIGPDGGIYITGTTYSRNYPTTPNAFRTTSIGGSFLTKLGVISIQEPEDGKSYCAGEFMTIRWSSGGGGLPYDVFFSADSGATFTPITFSVTTGTYEWFLPVSLTPGSHYRIRVTSSTSTESATSDTFVVNTPPRPVAQPLGQTVAPGGTATFTVAVSGTPEPTIQWQQKNGLAWTDIPGETSPRLVITNVPASAHGSRYRARLGNACRVITSDSATLTVPSASLLYPDGGQTLCAGTLDTIRWSTVANTGPVNISYSADGGRSWIRLASNVTALFHPWRIPDSLAGTDFRVRVELTIVQTGDESSTSFTISRRPDVTKNPVDVESAVDGSATFTATASGVPQPAVRWQVDTGTGFMPIPNASGTSLVLAGVHMGLTGNRYRAIFSNDCGEDTTAPATLTISDGPAGVERGSEAGGMRIAVSPNPARGAAELSVALHRPAHARIRLLDVRGNVLATLADGMMEAGAHRVPLVTAALANGTYVVELTSGKQRVAAKLTVTR